MITHLSAQASTIGSALLAGCVLVMPMALASAKSSKSSVVVVDATQGPVPSVQAEAVRLKQAGAESVHVKLENISELHDPQLIPLIEGEVQDMLAKNGFSPKQISFERCPKSCPR
ncbi:protein of unknown function [Nitrospira japonica]|uniref:Uncharacterized protein n=1 Tax=Nitrospira japonica TaxID=1325564 RepID=A0A1W1I9X9_9BACT|nr:hypothetical protein [Nitrospira japonica]SLM49800.1 protein of unknown function [Nitrospira japonica]